MKKLFMLFFISITSFMFINHKYDNSNHDIILENETKNLSAKKTTLKKYLVPKISHDSDIISLSNLNQSKSYEEVNKEEAKSLVNSLNIKEPKSDYIETNVYEESKVITKPKEVEEIKENSFDKENNEFENQEEKLENDEKEKVTVTGENTNNEKQNNDEKKEDNEDNKVEDKINDTVNIAPETKPIIKEDNYYSPSGKFLGTNNVKVIDVSYHQGIIDWDLFAKESDCYGVILRIGYWKTEDKLFKRNIENIKRLNIPYGIYIYSYASTVNGALTESNFTNQIIDKYNLEPSLGIYYDIESWNIGSSSSDSISKSMYDKIITTFINNVSSHVNNKYKVKVYSGRWYAMNRLGKESKNYVDWVAEYNKTCKYDGTYSLWQYTSSGSMPGINGRVDISYII